MGRDKNPAALRFADYADQHGSDAELESDWAARSDLEFERGPDFETRAPDHVQERLFTALP
jgi:hypothetical protein